MAQAYAEDVRNNKNGSYYEYIVVRPLSGAAPLEPVVITTCHWPGTPDNLGDAIAYVIEYRRNDVGTWTAFVSMRSNSEGLAAMPRLLTKLRGAVHTFDHTISVDTLEAGDYVPRWPTHQTGTYWTLQMMQDHVRSVLIADSESITASLV